MTKQEECTFSSTEIVGFDHNADTFVPCTEIVDSHGHGQDQARPSHQCQTVPEAVGTHGSCVQYHTFWLFVHDTFQWWLKNKGFSPSANSFHIIMVTHKYLRTLVMWNKPWFVAHGPVLGHCVVNNMLTTDAILVCGGVTIFHST